ncbi:MAG: LytTR family DNA-binding domain-containing protein [Bacteroidota bacterium]
METTTALRAVIADDEPLARDTVALLLDAWPRISVVGQAETGDEAVERITTLRPDLVFLDVQMPGKNGLEVVEAIGPKRMPVTIFATAYDQYALKAFDLHALDYLLKPYDDERFTQAVERAVAQVDARTVHRLQAQLEALVQSVRDAEPEPPAFTHRVLVKHPKALYFVDVDDIDYVAAAGDYVVLHAKGEEHMVRQTMTALVRQLDPQRFVRIHRSTIVNVDRIKALHPYFHGDYQVTLYDGKTLKLSRRYWSNIEGMLVGS